MPDRPWGNQPTAAPRRTAGLDVAEQRIRELELRVCELEAQAKVREGTVRELQERLILTEAAGDALFAMYGPDKPEGE